MYEDVTLIFDIDGTLCPIKQKEEKYEEIVPYKDMVKKIKYYKLIKYLNFTILIIKKIAS